MESGSSSWRMPTRIPRSAGVCSNARSPDPQDHAPPPDARIFLLPNDVDPGCLEDLLERLAAPPRDAVYGCLDELKQCLCEFGLGYQGPDRKGRVYAYCAAVGAETQPTRRDYDNAEHWNPEALALEPLRKFLMPSRATSK